jgi:hypothetical protein
LSNESSVVMTLPEADPPEADILLLPEACVVAPG